MKTPWHVEVYDHRVMVIGSYDQKTHRRGSFEVVLAQESGVIPAVADVLNLATQIVAAVNAS